MQRFFFSGASEAEPDKQGRVVIPAALLAARGARPRRRRRGRPRPPRDLGPRRLAREHVTESKGVPRMLPNVLQPSATDHVPVLAEEVRGASPCGRARRSSTPPSARAATPPLLAADLHGSGKLIAIDRDPTARAVLRAVRAARRAVQARLLRGDFAVVLAAARRERRRAPTRSCSTSASRRCSSTGPSAASRTPPTRRSTCAWIRRRSSTAARPRQRGERARARRRSSARYGEERYARQIAPRDRAPARREQPFERTGELVDTIKAAIPAPARFGDGHPGEARLPGAADRRQRRARLARGGAARRRSRCCGRAAGSR